MDPQTLLLALVVAAAAALQAATGIGFGVIAGPVLLMVLDSGAAIQISILLSLLIAGVLTPALWPQVEQGVLKGLLAGGVLGLPLGVGVFLWMELAWLKLLAALAVAFTLGFVLRGGRAARPAAGHPGPGGWQALGIGVCSGVMGGSLAMPGPLPAAWMTARHFSPAAVRATILALFVFSYLAALLLQMAWAGAGGQELWQHAWLGAPTLAGVGLGRLLVRRMTARRFRGILIVILAATVLSLLANALPALTG